MVGLINGQDIDSKEIGLIFNKNNNYLRYITNLYAYFTITFHIILVCHLIINLIETFLGDATVLYFELDERPASG